MVINPVSITEKAIAQIERIIKEKDIPAGYGLRIGYEGGGCGGSSRNILGFDTKTGHDMEFNIHGITVYIDKRQTMYLAGTTVDYHKDETDEGFIFLNKKPG